MVARNCRTISLALVLLATGSTHSVVRAQGNTFNPYGNSGYADYREFTTATYSNNPALPGQTRLDNTPLVSRPRANSFRQYLEEGELETATPRRGSSPNSKAYKPNDNPENQAFLDRLRKRDEAFAKAMQEKDPVKRSKMLRQIENESLATTAARAKTPSTSRAPDPNSVASGSATSRAPVPNRSTAPAPNGTRRSSAPPPPVGNTGRTSSVGPPPPINGTTPSRSGSTSATPKPATTSDPSSTPIPPPR
jgi:hypothetical protein